MQRLTFTLFALLTLSLCFGQIRLQNPSFEGRAQDATLPTGWHACNEGTTPDILPGPWGVYHESSDGETYMGLITREDGSWESVGQRLSKPLREKTCYSFSLDLAHSKTYAGYNLPTQLKIWGGQSRCGQHELLAYTPLINHSDWKTYEFELFPKKDVNYLILEVHYSIGILFAYRGNVLLDDCSSIIRCSQASNEKAEQDFAQHTSFF